MKLGQRLKAIADMVPSGSTPADIGTDHAYLPIYLVQQNIVPCAIAGDVHQGPYLSAQNAVASVHLEHHIFVRLGNGLEVVKPGEADVVVIAGMGGATIIDILRSCPEVTRTLKRLILQPMIAASLVRNWLHTHSWQIVEEQLVEEDGKLYQIIAAEPGESPAFETVLNEIGPLLWQTKHPLLQLHINELIKHLRGVLSAMQGSPDAVHSDKYREYASRLKELEDKLLCL
ncbi:tRNA (adenine(22)-N(1))-methyltransferase [Sporomusa malonica]|uniref:tRNA (Adenine22-N1)-methyltransferase n=1 Tax=Sporomusa malonica TaxID=112901 RepID=A0A1W2D9Z5_9FIRM|nr:class I SAM-dependent methyltransferase [Sporomusa malonica]SMC94203.1 tRNA (adenine22-N1)-methyltransferase [Sporomusa malonica]